MSHSDTDEYRILNFRIFRRRIGYGYSKNSRIWIRSQKINIRSPLFPISQTQDDLRQFFFFFRLSEFFYPLLASLDIRDEHGSGLDRTGSGLKPIFGRIRAGSDWQNFSCIYVIILNISKILVVTRFYRFAKWECILPWMAKALLRQFCNSNCIHLCEHITLSSSSSVNIQ